MDSIIILTGLTLFHYYGIRVFIRAGLFGNFLDFIKPASWVILFSSAWKDKIFLSVTFSI